MPRLFSNRFVLSFYCSIAVGALFCACGKKQDATPQASAQSANTGTNAAPADVAPAPIDPANTLAATDAALKARQYDQAVANLLKLQQQKNLTEQQAQALRDQQVRVQRNLASAVASGDPRAKAAAEMLRAANAHR